MKAYDHFVYSLAKYEEYPNGNKFLAGLHTLLWNHMCGDSWKQSFKLALIYWRPRKHAEP